MVLFYLILMILVIIVIQLFIIIDKLPRRDRVAEALERDRIAREQKEKEE